MICYNRSWEGMLERKELLPGNLKKKVHSPEGGASWNFAKYFKKVA
jgi:hypothetical protein